MADAFAEMTGVSAVEAQTYLEMAGGDLETALALFFDSGGTGGVGDVGVGDDVPMDVDQGPGGRGDTRDFHALLFGGQPVPAAWSGQGFEFSTDPAEAVGMVQHKNGPCGVLAALNAIIIAQAGCPVPAFAVNDEALASAIALVLVRCAVASATGNAEDAPESPAVVVATWAGEPGGEVIQEQLAPDGDAVAAAVLGQVKQFRSPGGAILLCYSAVLTRGVERVRQEAALDGGFQPLIVDAFALCSTELLGLLLSGVARGNVGAYGGDGCKVTWRGSGTVGLLSRDEVEAGRPLADELKAPSMPVYVIHGGDHFTVAWAPAVEQASAGNLQRKLGDSLRAGLQSGSLAAALQDEMQGEADLSYVDLWHWNGLPPNRALVRLRLYNSSLEPPPPAPEQHTQSHWRIRLGEVESIVQARPEDKAARPGCWRTFGYELALATQAVVDDDRSDERPEGMPGPPRFEQGDPPPMGQTWRCASCYQTRFATCIFGENKEPSEPNCKFCGRAQAEAGWTIWRQYEELPPGLQRRIDRTSGPRILDVLRTRWPDAEIALFDASGAEVMLGGAGFDPGRVTVPAC